MILALAWGWYAYDGDISYGRLTRIPYQEIQWYHAVAPAALLLLTRIGIPVSTTFLVLSAFASTFILEKMLLKSVMGYAIAAAVAYGIWFIVTRWIDEKNDPVRDKNKAKWRIAQWCSTGFLWYTWLSHDLANIAVYLPRSLNTGEFIGFTSIIVTLPPNPLNLCTFTVPRSFSFSMWSRVFRRSFSSSA